MTKSTTSLWRGIGAASLLVALSIMAVLTVNLPTAAYAKTTDETTELRPRHAIRGMQIASLGNISREAIVGHRDGLSAGPVRWTASAGCLNSELRRVVGQVAANFGPVTVNSTCRSARHNAAVGGARHSHHLGGNAVDFSLKGNVRAAHAFLSSQRSVGGLKHYADGHFHIDTGPRRTW